jgi:hypothetical protein
MGTVAVLLLIVQALEGCTGTLLVPLHREPALGSVAVRTTERRLDGWEAIRPPLATAIAIRSPWSDGLSRKVAVSVPAGRVIVSEKLTAIARAWLKAS